MSQNPTTIKIKHQGGYSVINESDFDPSKHELYKEPKVSLKKDTDLGEAPKQPEPEEASKEEPEKPSEQPQKEKTLSDLSATELLKYADSKDIKLKPGLSKTKMVEAIQAALGS